MATRDEDWSAVGKGFESLALKLKMHFEQAGSGASESFRTATEQLGDALDRSFDALRAAADDPAIRENAKEVATLLRDAVANTMAEIRRDLEDADRKR